MKSLLLAALAAFAFSASAIEIDGVAAKVGSETILRSDVIMEMRRINAAPSAYNDILKELIDRKLILKAAGLAKVTMQEWVVESRIREIINKAFNGDRNQLMDTLAKQKISYPEWHARMREDMIVTAMRWNVIDKNMTASPSAMRAEFAEHADRYTVDTKVTVAVILLTPEGVTNRNTIAQQLKTEDFGALAKRFSADSHASEGGVWKDVVPKTVFKAEICDEIAKMPKGTISHWIELDGWSFLLKKIDETPGKARSFEEAYDDIEANVKEAAAKQAYEAWLKRLREEAFVKIY